MCTNWLQLGSAWQNSQNDHLSSWIYKERIRISDGEHIPTCKTVAKKEINHFRAANYFYVGTYIDTPWSKEHCL